MRKMRRAALFTVCTFLTIVALAQSSEWKEYIYAEDGFAISSLSEPSLMKRPVKTKTGSVEVHIYVMPLQDAHLMIMYVEREPSDQRTPEQALEDPKKAVERAGAKLISVKPISLGKYPGIEQEMEDASFRWKGRYYMVDRKGYNLTVSVNKGQPYPEGLDRWYDSFRLVESKK